MSALINLTGKQFGRLTVLSQSVSHNANSRWLCKCECGKEKVILSGSLISGNTESCGCLQKEKVSGANTVHGCAKTGKQSTEYQIWQGMKERCYNPKHISYKNYGGRGIKVCSAWLNSFEAFLRDVGERPSKEHSLDRYPNINGDYEPTNFRWATVAEQNKTRRKWSMKKAS